MKKQSKQSMGGEARDKALTPEKKKEIATRASEARWSLPKAICGSPAKPLVLGNAEIPCYVLEDETRVLAQTAMIEALGMSRGSAGGSGDRLASFTLQGRFNALISKELRDGITNPIRFRASRSVAYGYKAEILAEICFAVDEADRQGLLQKQQMHIAKQARVLMKAFAVVGINALVDEATGYQEMRAKDALARILEKFIAKEFRPWTKTFPVEFYEHLFRLRGWNFDPATMQGPRAVAQYTEDIVYKRLAPGVVDELKLKNPRVNGRRKQKHHQWLTGEIGHPKLLAHIEGVKTLMAISDNWDQFMERLDKVYKRHETTELGLTVELKTKKSKSKP